MSMCQRMPVSSAVLSRCRGSSFSAEGRRCVIFRTKSTGEHLTLVQRRDLWKPSPDAAWTEGGRARKVGKVRRRKDTPQGPI